MDSHSFYKCPLRSSSLLIVNKEKQTIVTATDELLDILGYHESNQLLGKSIQLLNPIKKESFHLLKHKSTGYIPFEICIHHDPLANTVDLDYWLVHPVNITSQQNTMLGPVTILRLSPFGTIENAYPSIDFPQINSELQHRPIMSFVHESDVRQLCEKVSKTKYKSHHTLRIRWLDRSSHSSSDQDNFHWVMLTVMNAPRRLSCSSFDDLQSWPICVIRIVYESEQDIQGLRAPVNYCWKTIWLDALHGLVEQARRGSFELYRLVQSIHLALDQGKSYLVEFFAHALSYLLEFANELKYCYLSEMDKVECVKIKMENKKKNSKYSNTPSIRVYDNDTIYTIPFITKAFQPSNWTHYRKF